MSDMRAVLIVSAVLRPFRKPINSIAADCLLLLFEVEPSLGLLMLFAAHRRMRSQCQSQSSQSRYWAFGVYERQEHRIRAVGQPILGQPKCFLGLFDFDANCGETFISRGERQYSATECLSQHKSDTKFPLLYIAASATVVSTFILMRTSSWVAAPPQLRDRATQVHALKC